MQILRAPDFFLLTHGFGLSTRAITPSSLSRVRFRLEFFFQFFGYSPSWSNFGSHVFIHFYMCTTPGKQPSWRLNTARILRYHLVSGQQMVYYRLVLLEWWCGLEVVPIYSDEFHLLCSSSSDQGKLIFSHDDKSTEYFLRLAGLVTSILAVPSGVTSVLFHTTRRFQLC